LVRRWSRRRWLLVVGRVVVPVDTVVQRASRGRVAVILLAHPEATVNLRGTEIPVRGRLAHGDERARLWSLLTAVWPGYDGYASHTNREIRVYVLEPGQLR
jgi:hypothetical protein